MIKFIWIIFLFTVSNLNAMEWRNARVSGIIDDQRDSIEYIDNSLLCNLNTGEVVELYFHYAHSRFLFDWSTLPAEIEGLETRRTSFRLRSNNGQFYIKQKKKDEFNFEPNRNLDDIERGFFSTERANILITNLHQAARAHCEMLAYRHCLSEREEELNPSRDILSLIRLF